MPSKRHLIEEMERRILLSRALGVDVSVYQGQPTWSSVYSDGVTFAYAKATEGSSYTNPDFTYDMTNATAASVIVGAYDFADFNTVSATTEANHFLSVASSYAKAGYLKPVLDMEGSTSMTKTQVSDYINSWCTTVTNATGSTPIVYCDVSFASSYINSTVTNKQLWIASYNGQNAYTGQPSGTAPWSTWTLWQVSDTGSITGISGDVDLDVANGTTTGYLIPNVVSKAGATFTSGQTVHVNTTGGLKAWNTYASNDTYVIEANGTTGVIQGGPVYIDGYLRYPIKYGGSSTVTWSAGSFLASGAGSAATPATATSTLARPSVEPAAASTTNDSVLFGSSKKHAGLFA